jgi:tetratricopeptide (TPR) repeat protein
MKQLPAQSHYQKRVIRVFISSTFQDMKEERDELIKRVFPELRKICNKRGVTWGEVDLRWGITDEEMAEGKVLPICLDEIKNCFPFFIGILGERYGWVPMEIPKELIENEPWLEKNRDCSVTELEIMHGVLNNPELIDHSHFYFYFRDPRYIKDIPEEMKSVYQEYPTEEEIGELGIEEAKRRANDRKQQLDDLKSRIIANGLPVHVNYKNPQHLGRLIFQEMLNVIEKLFPQGVRPNPLDRDIVEHEAFALSKHKSYIGRDEYFERVDKHVQDDSPPLLLLGDSGSGKSAFLANWVVKFRKNHPDEPLIMHFIGATPFSADWAMMLRRIMGELKRLFNITDRIPVSPDDLKKAFAEWLHIASSKGRLVIILDALNQLEDQDNALDLVWLPPVIPENIRLVLSTLPGKPLDELKRRILPEMNIKPLELDERKRLVHAYLAPYRKNLSESQTDRIITAEQTHRPLFLRSLLEELRIFGIHEHLDARIDHYLAASTVTALFDRILERYEEDCEQENPGFVRDVMTNIWASRHGLSEAELLDLLGKDGEQLPYARWVPFYQSTEQAFVNRSGLIGFTHKYIRKAIEDRYLSDDLSRKAAHLSLADYFGKHEISSRVMDELPWQLAKAESWQRLYDKLADLDFFVEAWNTDEYEVKRYWAKIEASSSLRIIDAYMNVLESPDDVHEKETLIHVTILLADTYHPKEALILQKHIAEFYRKEGIRGKLIKALNNQAVINYLQLGNLDEAMELLKEQESICRELENYLYLSRSLNGQAVILLKRGDLDGAMAFLKEQERICRKTNDLTGLGDSLNNQALILLYQGDFKGSLVLQKKQESICREIGDMRGLHISYGNQAELHRRFGELGKAMELVEKKERICRDLGSQADIGSSLSIKALILMVKGEIDKALELRKEEERIFRELNDPLNLNVSLGNQAAMLINRGDLDESLPLLEEQEQICRKHDLPDGLALALINRAEVIAKKGNPEEALKLAEEAYKLAENHGYAEYVEAISEILDEIRAQIENLS